MPAFYDDMRDVVLKPSRYLRGIVWAAHLIAVVLILFTALPLWLQMPALVLVGFSLWRFHLRPAITALAMNEDSTLSLRDVAGNCTTYDVLGSSRVYAGIVVLALRETDGNARRDEVLLSDAMDAESFRQLRVWLLWYVGRQLHADVHVEAVEDEQ